MIMVQFIFIEKNGQKKNHKNAKKVKHPGNWLGVLDSWAGGNVVMGVSKNNMEPVCVCEDQPDVCCDVRDTWPM